MEQSLLPATWEVPAEFRNRLGTKAGRQRQMLADGHLLLVLHAPPKPDDNDRVPRLFWRAPDGTWSSTGMGGGIQALNQHLEEYYALIGALEDEEAKASTADEYFAILESTAPVWRASINLHRVLQETRKTCPEFREIINVRDRAYEVERTAELLYQGVKNSLDFAVVQRAEEQSRASQHMAVSSHRLNMLVALFFPIATLSTVFGVNLKHGFEESTAPFAFLAVIGTGLALGVVLTLFMSRAAK